MKKLTMTALGLVLGVMLAIPAIATDTENTKTTDSSKNPFTGTVTETTTTKKKLKNADGTVTKAETTDKKKIKKDGTVEKTHEAEASTEHE